MGTIGTFIGFIVFYVGMYFFNFKLIKEELGKLSEVQKAAIYGIAQKYDTQELINVVNQINEINPRILMPVKQNWILHTISILFLCISITTVLLYHIKFLSEFIVKNFEFDTFFSILITIDILFFIIGLCLVYLESKYLRILKRLNQVYSDNRGKKIIICVD